MADTTTTATTDSSTTPIPSFAGFSDFDLDLSSLSPETSPNNSTTGIPLTSEPSTPRSSRTPSFFSQANFSSDGRPAKKMSPTLMVSPSVATTVIRGSWPLIRYVGRGTPVDKTRRVEWGTLGGEEVTEDGLLFSSVRSASLDSTSRRPVSQEWNFSLGHSSSSQPTLKAHDHGFPRSKSKFFDQPPPELAPISIGADNSDDWSSLMHKVLQPSTPDDEKGKTTDEAALPDPGDPEAKTPRTEEVKDHNGEEHIRPTESAQPATGGEGAMTPEEIRQLDMELGNNLGLNEALNLGLSLRGDGMNLFNLGIIPSSGQDTPSVYPSDEGASRTSRPLSVQVLEATSDASLGTRSDDYHPAPVHGVKTKARSWWGRFVKSFRRVHNILHLHSPKQG
ncbi:hypothetical protein JOM56_000955 [Amanita muscaria]